MSSATLAHLLAGVRDLAVGRAAVFARLRAVDPATSAREIDALARSALGGVGSARDAMIVVASFVAHVGEGVHEVSAVADAARDLELGDAAAILCAPRRLRLGRSRLAEVSMAMNCAATGMRPRRYPDETPAEWNARMAVFSGTERRRLLAAWGLLACARRHHDPRFIARLLEQPWLTEADVVVIASRRPMVAAIQYAIATRDRWIQRASVRRALFENPYTPRGLAHALAATVATRDRLSSTLSRSRPGP